MSEVLPVPGNPLRQRRTVSAASAPGILPGRHWEGFSRRPRSYARRSQFAASVIDAKTTADQDRYGDWSLHVTELGRLEVGTANTECEPAGPRIYGKDLWDRSFFRGEKATFEGQGVRRLYYRTTAMCKMALEGTWLLSDKSYIQMEKRRSCCKKYDVHQLRSQVRIPLNELGSQTQTGRVSSKVAAHDSGGTTTV
ncbi:hypothetical protein PAXINDRAFT_158893 [Paxillus involutus ATCC 200175]|uniref:Uncharacterized protein n=1 Tax=Paxillus involutus ATCC 200175 TaxID=664439 RepID=A0A0C9TCL1_PAXIN|nr:hypothetical protein PAXINDRAFT_158893 [Paxillus involutus ATCC 200175]